MENLVTRKCQICQKKDFVKQPYSPIVMPTCFGRSASERRSNLKRYWFLARWGRVRSVRSNNGANFVSTDKKLRKALEKMHQEHTSGYLQQDRADWITSYKNPLIASHMDGEWESQIRRPTSIHAALLMTYGQIFNDEGFGTSVSEI